MVVKPLKTMTDQIENLDSSNEEPVEESTDALKERLQKVEETNRQLFARAKKAEGFEQDAEGNWVKYEKKAPLELPKQKSGKIDYGELAYLETKGITEEDDIEYIRKESEDTGKPLNVVLGFKYVQEHLKDVKEGRISREAMPAGSKRSSGAMRDSVDYWLAKGQLPMDQPELARKVVKARLAAEEARSKFSDNPIIR